MDGEAYLNSTFKHFYYFINEFKLIEAKELQPLIDVINNLVNRDKEKSEKKE